MKLELDAPSIGNLEKEYLCKAVEAGFVSTFGPFVSQFEEKFAQYLGVNKAASLQSGTAAIHMALYELGIGQGDEVIVPATTFVATVNPVLYVGAKPVFVDVDKNTWNISPAAIEKNITKKTKAIIPVHLYGNPCDMARLMEIARKHNLYVIEDATESLGAIYKGKYTGTFGDFGCFSFNGNKIITTGGGGMIVGRDAKKIKHIKFLINQAKDSANSLYHTEMGFNYRMTNLEAALGLAQLEKLNKFIEKKRIFNEIYREQFKKNKLIRFQEECDGAKSSWWFTCAIFAKKIKVSMLQDKLKEKGIPTRRIFMPIIKFPFYKNCRRRICKNSYAIYEAGMCLPSSTLNSRNDIYYVCKTLKMFL